MPVEKHQLPVVVSRFQDGLAYWHTQRSPVIRNVFVFCSVFNKIVEKLGQRSLIYQGYNVTCSGLLPSACCSHWLAVP